MKLEIGLAACVFRSVEMLTVARQCGFDFLVADMEHSAMSLGEAATLSVAGIESGFPVHVRVPGVRSDYLTRVVDCGALGLIVPHVDSVEEARDMVDRVRFPPCGRRSIPSPVAMTGFRPLPAADLFQRCEAALKVTVMIESVEGLAAVRGVTAVEGIDVIMAGANDLAQSLGHSGNVAHGEVQNAFRAIASAALENGRKFGVIGLPPELMRSHALDLGAGVVVATNEINLLINGGTACAREYRDLARTAGPAMEH